MPAATTIPDPLIGRTFGNVTLTARLGAGAMGVVYRGWHGGFGREVAVKLLLAKPDGNPSYRERFLREGRAAAKVSNEHVVQVLDAGQQDDIAYLVMELVSGTNLGAMLSEAGQLAPDLVQRLGVGISIGLAAIHAKGIVHRDIKPDNILVGADHKPKVADLGLAKQLDNAELQRLTATGMVVGTPLYLSPEAIRDPQCVDAKSDIYSLGVTLYQVLVGRLPFGGTTPFEVMRGHLDTEPTPIRMLRPEVPQALAETVELCLTKEPARRPTALELADLLTLGVRPRRPLPWRLIGGSVAALALAAVAWVALNRPGPTPPTPPTSAPVVPPANARLRVMADAPSLRVRVDDGAWQTVTADGIVTPPGSHRILVEAVQDGPLLRGAGQGSLAAGEAAELRVDLDLVSVPPARVVVLGTGGMIFVDGVAYGPDPVLTCARAGRFSVARWTGDTWHAAMVEVDDAGSVIAPAWSIGDVPPATAYWSTRSEHGRPRPAHHVLCWWEAERARAARALPMPVGWTAQGTQPEQPAMNLTLALVQACAEDIRRLGGRLPDRSHALDLAEELQTALWCQDQGRIDKVGGAGAQVVVVPE